MLALIGGCVVALAIAELVATPSESS
jgi:hypothetical protein